MPSSEKQTSYRYWTVLPFFLDGLSSPDRVFRRTLEESRQARDTLEGALSPYGWAMLPSAVEATASESGLLLDSNESYGAARVPDTLAKFVLEGSSLKRPGWPDMIDELVLTVGALGVCAFSFSGTARSASGMLGVEREVIRVIQDELDAMRARETFSSLIATRDDEASGAVLDERPPTMITPMVLLWAHRLGPMELAPPFCAAEPPDSIGFRVGFGFTTMEQSRGDLLASEVLRGIFHATEDWLVIDGANRALTAHLVESVVAEENRTASLAGEVNALVRQGQLLALYLEERNRYLTGARRATWTMARQVWGVDAEYASLEGRIVAARDLSVSVWRDFQAREAEAAGNSLFVLAFLAVIQSFLLVFDFAVADDASPGPSSRTVVAALSLIITVGITWVAVRRIVHRVARRDPGRRTR